MVDLNDASSLELHTTAQNLPTEILHHIYQFLHPLDFDAARSTCRTWHTASRSLLLLQAVARRAGWSECCAQRCVSPSRRVDSLDRMLAFEASLHPNHYRWREAQDLTTRSDPDPQSGITDSVASDRDTRQDALHQTIAVGRKTHISLSGLVSQLKHTGTSYYPLTPAFSTCANFLLLTSNATIYIYSLASFPASGSSHSETDSGTVLDAADQAVPPTPTFIPVTTIRAPRRVLAVSMDTSAGRFAVAALLDNRVGMVCELDQEADIPTPPSPGVYGRVPSTTPKAPESDEQLMHELLSRPERETGNLAVVRYRGPPRAHRDGNRFTPQGQTAGGDVNVIHIRSPTQNVHLFNASMDTTSERTWPAVTSGLPAPIVGTASRKVQELTDGDLAPVSSARAADAPPSAPESTIGGVMVDEGERRHAQRHHYRSPPLPTTSAPLHLYPHICSPTDPPRSIAICPSRRCVAFGCAAGVELHWVSEPSRPIDPTNPTNSNTPPTAATANTDASPEHPVSTFRQDIVSRQYAEGKGTQGVRNLMKWFPLTAPSEVLAFLPWRQGVDGRNRLRLVSSVDLPRARRRNVFRQSVAGGGRYDLDDGVGESGEGGAIETDTTLEGALRGWEGVMGARGRVWRALRRWAWDHETDHHILGPDNLDDYNGWREPIEGRDANGFDHYRAIPLADGTHMLFVDPMSGDLMLGSDDLRSAGTARLVRKVRFVPPASIFQGEDEGADGQGLGKSNGKRKREDGSDRTRGTLHGYKHTPTCYAADRNLSRGVRVAAAYGDVVVLYTVPVDVFRDLARVGGAPVGGNIFDRGRSQEGSGSADEGNAAEAGAAAGEAEAAGRARGGNGNGFGREAWFVRPAQLRPTPRPLGFTNTHPLVGYDDGLDLDTAHERPRQDRSQRGYGRREGDNGWGEWAQWWGHGRPLRSTRRRRGTSGHDSASASENEQENSRRGVTDFLPLIVRGVVVGECKGVEALAVISPGPGGKDGDDDASKDKMSDAAAATGLAIWAVGEARNEAIVWNVGISRVDGSDKETQVVNREVGEDGSVLDLDHDT